MSLTCRNVLAEGRVEEGACFCAPHFQKAPTWGASLSRTWSHWLRWLRSWKKLGCTPSPSWASSSQKGQTQWWASLKPGDREEPPIITLSPGWWGFLHRQVKLRTDWKTPPSFGAVYTLPSSRLPPVLFTFDPVIPSGLSAITNPGLPVTTLDLLLKVSSDDTSSTKPLFFRLSTFSSFWKAAGTVPDGLNSTSHHPQQHPWAVTTFIIMEQERPTYSLLFFKPSIDWPKPI